MTRRHIALIALLLSPVLAVAQAGVPAEQLRQGLLLFRQERFQEAAQSFLTLIQDPQAGAARPEAYYWAARSYAAVDQLEDAGRYLEHFLVNYPSNPLYADGLYQKGRILYLQGEAESAVQVLGAYVDGYPEAEMVSSGYFWIAESLYSLGQIDEAARIYGTILSQYPKSVKLEAARYRLSLIEFKQREEELLKLLQWSHQEALKAVEEFQRREKAYEQAIASYQGRLGGGAGVAPSSQELETLKREKAALEARLQQLQARLAAAEAAPAPGAGGSAQSEELAAREALLRLMSDALELKQALLDKLAQQMRKSE